MSRALREYVIEYSNGMVQRTVRVQGTLGEARRRARVLVRRGARNRAFARVREWGQFEILGRWLNVAGEARAQRGGE